MFEVSSIPAVNVATVPQRSPLRYPGGKTWLIPHIRAWLAPMEPRPKLLVEPFCGGATVSLTGVFERLIERCLMVELDRDVAAFLALRSPARTGVKRIGGAVRADPGKRECFGLRNPSKSDISWFSYPRT